MSEGHAEIAVGDEDGRVILRFHQPLDRIAIDPENARLIAEAIARAAYKCVYGVFPQPRGSQITKMKRALLVGRVALIMQRHQEQKKAPAFTAEQIVEQILSETL